MAGLANQRLARARGAVERVSQMLISPTPGPLDLCSGLLAGAVEELTACRETGVLPGIPDVETLREARLLAGSLRRARRLLDGAAAYHAQWIRCVGALCAGYTDRGEPAEVALGSQFWTRG